MDKTIIRKEHNKLNPYAQISRKTLQDKNLSWKAKGLLAYLLSLPGDWQIYQSELPAHSLDGIKSTRTAFKELIVSGYISGNRKRNEKGLYLGYEYIVHESPKTLISIAKCPHAQNRHADNGTLHNIDSTKERFNTNKEHRNFNQEYDAMDRAELEAHGYTYTAPMRDQ